ncbi:MAG: DeoR/GlpR transcriptional regulator [Acidimicrobiales bacterium]|nr:DeoR/GlpR transcriptional regulator [Acidimicrobiales bacterium]
MSNQPIDTPTPVLFQAERQREIVGLTAERGRVEVAELAGQFGVTTETIRRDLSELQQQRMLRRVHGGAVPWETSEFEPLLSVRADLHDSEKRRIARRAVQELPDTGAILIDSGSTLSRFSEAIPQDRSLRIVTNSVLNVLTLAKSDAFEVTVIGGILRKNTLAMVDAQAVEAVAELSVDTLFISSDGFSPARGLTTPYREEAAIKKAMIRAADRVVALVDHSKFGHDHLVRFAEWSDVDVLVTTSELGAEAVAEIEATGTTVVLA